MFVTVRVENWEHFRLICGRMFGWIFRGQPVAHWALRSSLERLSTAGLVPAHLRDNREEWILHQFQRRGHLVLASPPGDNSHLEWLSVIQHYGGPTRLVDFTHSIYVATFFAVEPCMDCDAAIWAVNGPYLMERNVPDAAHKTLIKLREAQLAEAEAILAGQPSDPGVLQVEPRRLNERMAIQKGVFLFPRQVNQSVLANLAATIESDVETLHDSSSAEVSFDEFARKIFDNPSAYRAAKIILARKAHEHAIEDLTAMNIDASTLFPGLEGFARSLGRSLRMPAFMRYPELIVKPIDET